MKNNINLHKAPETRVYAKDQGEASTWDGPLNMEQGGPITERAKGL